MCDFGEESSSTPRVIAPSTSYMSGITTDLDIELSGIDPPVLSGLTQSMAIVVDEQTILYLGYSESSNHYLTKVGVFFMILTNIIVLQFKTIF